MTQKLKTKSLIHNFTEDLIEIVKDTLVNILNKINKRIYA